MDCSKKSKDDAVGAVAVLPDDPLVEILSRVPARSLCRFKCVCKAWRDLIADPHHRKKLPQAMQGLFFMADRFGFIDLVTARSVPLDIDPAFSFLTEQPGFQDLSLVDSCNGLVLLEFENLQADSDALDYVVCNPTTKRWQAVPTCDDPLGPGGTCTYLAFDQAISSHFHLVQIQECVLDEIVLLGEFFLSVRAYSSETRTWSGNQVGSQENQQLFAKWYRHAIQCHRSPECAFVNGFLHFIIRDWDQLEILVVDVQGKARRVIAVPVLADGKHCYLGQSQGCLHFMTQELCDAQEETYKLSIWVLQDYDTQDWVLKDTVSSLDIFGHWTSDILQFIVGIHQDCNVLFFSQPSSSELIAYNMDHKKVSVIATLEVQGLCRFPRYVPCFSESPALTN